MTNTARPGGRSPAQDRVRTDRPGPRESGRGPSRASVWVIETTDPAAVVEIVTEYELTACGVGEWSGTVEDRPALLRLVSRTQQWRGQADRTLTSVAALIESARSARSARTGPRRGGASGAARLLAAARESRWF